MKTHKATIYKQHEKWSWKDEVTGEVSSPKADLRDLLEEMADELDPIDEE